MSWPKLPPHVRFAWIVCRRPSWQAPTQVWRPDWTWSCLCNCTRIYTYFFSEPESFYRQRTADAYLVLSRVKMKSRRQGKTFRFGKDGGHKARQTCLHFCSRLVNLSQATRHGMAASCHRPPYVPLSSVHWWLMVRPSRWYYSYPGPSHGQEQDRGTACYAEFEYIYVYPALFIKLTEEIAPRSRPPWFH